MRTASVALVVPEMVLAHPMFGFETADDQLYGRVSTQLTFEACDHSDRRPNLPLFFGRAQRRRIRLRRVVKLVDVTKLVDCSLSMLRGASASLLAANAPRLVRCSYGR